MRACTQPNHMTSALMPYGTVLEAAVVVVELRLVHLWGAHEVICERAQHGGGESE